MIEDFESTIKDNFKTTHIFNMIISDNSRFCIKNHNAKKESKYQCWLQYYKRNMLRLEEQYPIEKKYDDEMEDDLRSEFSNPEKKDILLHDRIFADFISIRTKSANKIRIHNCIFEKGLSIESLENKKIDITVFGCIIIGNLSFGRAQRYGKILIDNTYIKALNLGDTFYDELSLYKSEIIDTRMEDTSINNIIIKRCHIKTLYCKGADINDVDIDIDSFSTYETLENLTPSLYIDDENATNELLDFILILYESKQIANDINLKADLMYTYNKYKNKTLARIMLFPVGYFYKPLRVVISSIIFILLFGIIYCLISEQTIYDSIYFSGITFFTVGYSDIDNMNVIKDFMVLVEAAIGISMTGSFLTSLLNKYIK